MIHICQPEHCHLNGMKEFYAVAGMLATSENADIALIRSHIAYHAGSRPAERASIKPSRGHSYRVSMYGAHDKFDLIVRITDHYDHRNGVSGII